MKELKLQEPPWTFRIFDNYVELDRITERIGLSNTAWEKIIDFWRQHEIASHNIEDCKKENTNG